MSSLRPQSRISHYWIKGLIARGGMGEVYKAVDDRLGRVVALKILSPSLAADENARRRFLREARAASMLSHPSICTVFEVGEEDALVYIVMQYVEGKTVKQMVSRGPLQVETALGCAIDVAAALEEAHKNGIIHRDIKPSNIIISERGTAVVLDFGLAKQLPFARSQAEETPTLSQVTTEASVVGTTAYMSPEQVRGQALDGRSDIFSFGVVLYEMLAGQRPFDGPGDIEIMHTILYDEPRPMSELRPEVEIELERIVRKALRKNPADRYQSVVEMKMELVKLIQERGYVMSGIRTVSDVTVISPTKAPAALLQRLLSPWGVLTGIMASIMIGAIWWGISRTDGGSSPDLLSSLRIVPQASWKSEHGDTGVMNAGTFSHDGRMIAYSSTRAGSRDIWIKQILSDESIRVTKDEWNDWSPIWSPDGQQIAFASDRGNQPGIWVSPTLGGSPTLLSSLEDGRPYLKYWTRNGKTIYFELSPNLFALDIASRQTTQLTHFDPSKRPPQEFSVSRDEKQIAYVDIRSGQTDLWVLPMGAEEPIQLTNDPEEDRFPVWHPDNERIVYSCNRGGIYQLCAVSIDGFKQRQITFGESDISVLDVSTDGTRILYYGAQDESDIWGVRVESGEELHFTTEIGVELWPDISPDGKTIAFQVTSELRGGTKLFNCRILTKPIKGDASQVQVASDGFGPMWSADGTKLAFVRRRGNLEDIWTVKGTGGDEKRLTTGGVHFSGYSFLPYNRWEARDYNWSPDSRRMVYCSNKSGQSNVWIVSADGSNDTRISENADGNLYFFGPAWSPDGKRLAFASMAGSASTDGKRSWSVWVTELGGGKTEVVFKASSVLRLIGWSGSGDHIIVGVADRDVSYQSGLTDVNLFQVPARGGHVRMIARMKSAYLSNSRLSPDGRLLALASRQDGRDNIYVVPVISGGVRKMTRNTDPRVYHSDLTWSPDGMVIYYGKQTRSSLVSMIENFR